MTDHLSLSFLDVGNEESGWNNFELEYFESEKQSTRHDSIQHLGEAENENDDTNRKKSENKARNFCVESVKRSHIEKVITNSLSVCEIELAIKSIPEQKEHHIFKNHAEPAKTFLFPTCFEGGCYRSFLKDWLKMFPWLLYGRIADGEFYKVILMHGMLLWTS